ncbi:MAG: ribonuclease E inhibitor RraB [Janthinobacterium lividum]
MNSSLQNLEELFSQMQRDGLDTSLTMKWGFFFLDKNKKKLAEVFTELEDSNYKLESIYKAETSSKLWTLHVSKLDILTPEKLHKRNLAFNNLADHCEIALYDGWDVERIS